MKTDIDHLMQEANIDAILVLGSASHNPAMTYFTGIVHVGNGYLLKKRGEQPILLHDPMEREEAASTGLRVKDYSDYNPHELIEETKGDTIAARAMLMARFFEDHDVKGRISFYGRQEIGNGYSTLAALKDLAPDVEIVGESIRDSVLTQARITKDEDEINHIRKVGEATVSVVGDVVGFLSSHQAKDGVLVDRQGEVLTIGEVKRRINLWLMMRRIDNPEDCIFSIGRDAGIPHSTGEHDHPVEIGKTIIFDIFPCEPGGGYHFDFTRTWCLGHAPDEVQQVYDDVLHVYQDVYDAIEPGRLCREFQQLTCDLFKERGHPTACEDPNAKEGYVHSLAHGIGLSVHEPPNFYTGESNNAILQPGSVITVEPGLYYPDRGLGVRLENTVWVRPDGVLETLVDFPMDLVIDVQDA
ncbi:MAG: M24 family metallopeptidase [Anaerolineales bacterium]|nr:M24 family metallopeptidase [Anaerolineales bacterium]